MKILIIDDDPVTCHLIETLLHVENLQTVSATYITNGDIISLLDSVQPDMLLLDYHLEQERSLKYVEQIRSNPAWRHLPILITSGIDHRQACLEAGANGFVLKPFNWQDLIAQIKQLFEQQSKSG